MFQFKVERDLALLTATRTGFWSLRTVTDYEAALRDELGKLHRSGQPFFFIIDVRSSGAQSRDVADALRAMVGRLGPLQAHRSAIVTSSGLAKLQAKQAADIDARVFTSMVLARDWVLGKSEPTRFEGKVFDEPSVAEAIGPVVRVQGPSDVDVTITAGAALETAKRISDAALHAVLASASHAGPSIVGAPLAAAASPRRGSYSSE